MTELAVIDIPADEYHRDLVAEEPCLSASIANLLITRSPRHAFDAHPKLNPLYQERKAEERFDVGTALHAALLEGKHTVKVIEKDSWRSQEAKDARDEARREGFTPLLKHQWDELLPLFDAFRAQLEQHTADPVPFTDGKPEQTLVWDEDGVTCKARIDWLRDDRAAFDDLKTTSVSAKPEAWARTAYGMGAPLQAAMYLRGARAHGWDPVWRWVVVETAPPFALSVFDLAPDALAIADDQLDWAINKWRDCLASGVWPAYSDRVASIEAPGYFESQWLEQKDAA